MPVHNHEPVGRIESQKRLDLLRVEAAIARVEVISDGSARSKVDRDFLDFIVLVNLAGENTEPVRRHAIVKLHSIRSQYDGGLHCLSVDAGFDAVRLRGFLVEHLIEARYFLRTRRNQRHNRCVVCFSGLDSLYLLF